MKRPVTTSSVNKKGRFLSIFVFVSFFAMAVSSLISNPVSASSQWDNLIINQQPLNISIYNNSPKVLSPSDPISDYEKYIINKEFHSPSFSDFLNPQYKNSPDYQQFQSESYDYESGARWAIFSEPSHMGNSLYPVSTPLLVFADSDFEMVPVLDYYKRPTWMLKNRSNQTKEIRYYRFLVSSGFNTFPFTGFSGFSYQKTSCAAQGYCFLNGRGSFTSLKSFVNNFDIQYPDNYSGDQFITEYFPLLSFTPVLSGQIQGQELSAIVEKDNMLHDFDYFFNQKYQYKLYLFNNQDSYDLIDTKILSFSDPYKYNFSANSSNGFYKVEVLPILQPPFTIKYDFKSAFIPLEYKGFSTNTYFSTKNVPFGASKPQFIFENCDTLDISCHIRNVITTISKAFYDFGNFLRNFLFKDVVGFLKWLFVPSENFLKNSFTQDSIRNIGSSFFSYTDAFVVVKEMYLSIFNALFTHQIGYSKPCHIFPKINIFGQPAQLNVCVFESFIGESNFNVLKTFNSLVLMFAGMFVVRGLVVKVGLMLLGGGFTE